MSSISSQLVTDAARRSSLLARIALVALVAAALAVGIVAWATDGFSKSSPTPIRVAPATAEPQYIGGHGDPRPTGSQPSSTSIESLRQYVGHRP
jgi:hypothetical protein